MPSPADAAVPAQSWDDLVAESARYLNDPVTDPAAGYPRPNWPTGAYVHAQDEMLSNVGYRELRQAVFAMACLGSDHGKLDPGRMDKLQQVLTVGWYVAARQLVELDPDKHSHVASRQDVLDRLHAPAQMFNNHVAATRGRFTEAAKATELTDEQRERALECAKHWATPTWPKYRETAKDLFSKRVKNPADELSGKWFPDMRDLPSHSQNLFAAWKAGLQSSVDRLENRRPGKDVTFGPTATQEYVKNSPPNAARKVKEAAAQLSTSSSSSAENVNRQSRLRHEQVHEAPGNARGLGTPH